MSIERLHISQHLTRRIVGCDINILINVFLYHIHGNLQVRLCFIYHAENVALACGCIDCRIHLSSAVGDIGRCQLFHSFVIGVQVDHLMSTQLNGLRHRIYDKSVTGVIRIGSIFGKLFREERSILGFSNGSVIGEDTGKDHIDDFRHGWALFIAYGLCQIT
ncbi:hypothetical protein SDC9_144580 [bioreactor metagenome]|uniref:Uncharacterized protein n=1 Tax=bioreactor metagenome TaxID=1076179 RepID=A0A645E6K7_9ZZZZ